MRALALAFAFAFVVIVIGVSCSKKPGPSGIMPRSGSPPGTVTLRFVNGTGADVYVARSWSTPYSIESKDGTRMPGPHFCQSECGKECECNSCGSPMESSEKIAPGAAFEAKWEGTYYEDGRCEKGCGCAEKRFAEDGTYTVTLGGARGVTKDAQIDPASPKCTAKGTVTLRAGAQSVDFPFTCSP